MANWRKIIVSGSDAELNSLDVVSDITIGPSQIISSSAEHTKLSGSFSGSFTGDVNATTFSFDIDAFGTDLTSQTLEGTDKILVSDGGTDGRGNISQLATPLAGTGLEANSGTIRIAAAAAGSGLAGGSGIPLSLDTSSGHFTGGIKQKLDADNVVSSSIQVDVRNTTGIATIATTGSNTFTGVQTISDTTNSTTYTDGALIVQGGVGIAKDVNISGSLTVTGLLTAVSTSIQYVTSSQYTVGTSRIILNDDDIVRFAGISVIDSGSTAGSGSLLWDSLNNHWVYQNETGAEYNSAIIIAGPKNYGALGDEEGLIAGRVPVATGVDHIDTNLASSSIAIDFDTLRVSLEAGLSVTGSIATDSLTQHSVVVVGGNGELTEYDGLTFNGENFTVSGSQLSFTGDSVSVTSDNNITIESTAGIIDISSTGDDITISTTDGQISLEATDGVYISSSAGTQVTGNLTILNGGVTASAFTGSFTGTFEGDIPAFLYVTASDNSTATIDLQEQALTLATSSATPENITITAAGQTITFALTDDVTIAKTLTASTASILGDLVVDGDLTINGTTTSINTQNLLVEDKFILLASGSVGSTDGGIIVDAGNGTGHALYYDEQDSRWGVNENLSATASSAVTTAYVANVVDMSVQTHVDNVATYAKIGNIKVENGDIFIWA